MVLKFHLKGFDLFPLGGFENFGVWFMEAMGKFDDMAGSWNSYQGLRGIPGYHGTVIEEILPVDIQSSDDRVDKTQGIQPIELHCQCREKKNKGGGT